MQQCFNGARTREVEEDPILVLFDLSCHFEEGEDHGRGLGLGQRGLWERLSAEGMMQDRGGTRQQKPPGVGEEGRCGGAVAVESTLDRLDMVFTMPARTVDVLIHALRGGATKEVTTKRGWSPEASTSAWRRTRQGWAQEAAP